MIGDYIVILSFFLNKYSNLINIHWQKKVCVGTKVLSLFSYRKLKY
jgi:hypothetical protein